MRKKVRSLFSAIFVAGVVASAAGVRADTITVTSASENVATGVYTYSISLDPQANVGAGDGFVIYDFPKETSYSISGGFSTAQFTLTHSGSSNGLSMGGLVDNAASAVAAANGIPFDLASVDNLTFTYLGLPIPFTGAANATLTIDTSLHSGLSPSVSSSLDHSGLTITQPFSELASSIFVPASATDVPLPGALVGGSVLMVLVGIGAKYKDSRNILRAD